MLLLEYPSFQHLRRNELSLTLSPAVQKPDQADAAYKSFPGLLPGRRPSMTVVAARAPSVRVTRTAAGRTMYQISDVIARRQTVVDDDSKNCHLLDALYCTHTCLYQQ